MKKKGTGYRRPPASTASTAPWCRSARSTSQSRRRVRPSVKFTASGNVSQTGKITFTIPKLKRKATWIFRASFDDNEANGWNYSSDKGRFTF